MAPLRLLLLLLFFYFAQLRLPVESRSVHQQSETRMNTGRLLGRSMLPDNSTVAAAGIDCGGACEQRCKLASRQNMCKRACGTCCARCSCVPPGTSGNYEACACYAYMTTHEGRRKCP